MGDDQAPGQQIERPLDTEVHTVRLQLRLMIEAGQTRHEALLPVMLAHGLRCCEALGLHWAALDWDAATLKVTHGVKRVRDRTASELQTYLVVGELKTARSRRTLFLTRSLLISCGSIGPGWTRSASQSVRRGMTTA